MAQQHYKTLFKKALLQFITEPDPFLAMLKWVMTEMMRIETEAKVGATKGKHAKCVFRGIPAGYSDGKRPPFRAKPATDSDGKAATFGRLSERWPEWLGKLRSDAG